MLTMIKRCVLVALLVGPISVVQAQSAEEIELQRMQQFIKVMQGYYQIINDIHGVSKDPDKSAILQLQKIEEIYKQRGDRAEAIKVMRDVVDTTKSDIVCNAATMMLSDALNETGQASEAVEVLQKALQKNLR